MHEKEYYVYSNEDTIQEKRDTMQVNEGISQALHINRKDYGYFCI